MFKKTLAVLLIAFAFSAQAQHISFSDTIGGSIPDAGPAVYFPIVVSSPLVDSLTGTYGFESIKLSISHTYDNDLEAQLQAPDGTIIPLFQNIGGGGDSFTNTRFTDTASNSITSGTAPFTGDFKPIGSLWQLNNHHSGNGTWYLIVRDDAAADTGSLIYATITFGAAPALPPPPITSNIPIVKIYTDSLAPIVDNPKIGAWMKIVDHGGTQRNGEDDTTFAFVGRIGIEFRGSSSQTFPKKSYGFETWAPDSNGLQVDTSILGFPAESDWILNAHYTDKTLFRNNLSYDMARDMGHYASRVKFVELFVNDEYEGVYVAMEKIKRDPNRVNISKLKISDTTGTQLTGGYIMKIDKFTGSGGAGWTSSVPVTNSGGSIFPYIQYVYPSQDSIQPAQATYIKAYMDSFEYALNDTLHYQDTAIGFRKYADESTFIDYEIINEMAKNVDGYRLSTFFYKEKITHGNKLKMGPVWDYDIAYDNADYCGGYIDTGWAYDYNYVCQPSAVPFWWERLMSDSVYARRLYCRYHELRTAGPLRFDSLFAYIDSNAALLSESQQRNFVRWPILGVYVWPNPQPLPTTYAGEIQQLKDWLTSRLSWLDTAIGQYATPDPTVTLGRDTTICQGQALILDPGQYYQYTWSSGNTHQTQTVTQAGHYQVSVSTYYGCPAMASVNVNVQTLPIANFVKTPVDSNNYVFTPFRNNEGSYAWDFGDSILSAITIPHHHYDSAGTYTVTLTVRDSIGCETTFTDTIHVSRQPSGINDVHESHVRIYPNPASEVVYVETEDVATLVMTNILGEKMFSRSLPKGTTAIDVRNLPQGVYIMTVTEKTNSLSLKWMKE